MNTISPTETLEKHINQRGITVGPRKLALLTKAMQLRGVPKLYSQDGKGDNATVYVKLFNPAGGQTWYVLEWDGADEFYCFMTGGGENEYGYQSLTEFANTRGPIGIGIEIDVWFTPKPLGECVKTDA